MEFTKESVALYFDHTLLKAFATKEDIIKLCNEAKEIGSYSVCVNPTYVKTCKELLEKSTVKVCSVIDFPLGSSDLESKEFELKKAVENGAEEVDYVLNVGRVKMHDWEYITKEMDVLTKAAHNNGAGIKVIIETCYLTKEEIKEVSLIAKEVKPDFVKTSTGFGTGGATVEDVKLMSDTVEGLVKVKASGGIRTWQSCKEMIEAGANRIGVSASLNILKEFENEK